MDTAQISSAQQQEIYGYLQPLIARMSAYGQGGLGGQPLWQLPGLPQAPRYQSYNVPGQQTGVGYNVPGQQTGVGYNVPTSPGAQGYNVPNIQSMMPTGDWYNNLDPSIMAGIRQPYTDASRQLTESMGGSAGSARGGPTGALGSSQADFWSKAGTQMGQQAWGMVSPALQQGWGAQLGANQYGAQTQNALNQQGWQAALGANQYGAQTQNALNQQGWQAQLGQAQNQSQMQNQSLMQDYGMNQQLWGQAAQQSAYPWNTMPGMLGGTYPTNVATPSGPSTSDQLMQMLMMGGMMYAM